MYVHASRDMAVHLTRCVYAHNTSQLSNLLYDN